MNTFILCCVPSADDKSYVLKYFFVQPFDERNIRLRLERKEFLEFEKASTCHVEAPGLPLARKNVVAEETFLLARNMNLARCFVGAFVLKPGIEIFLNFYVLVVNKS